MEKVFIQTAGNFEEKQKMHINHYTKVKKKKKKIENWKRYGLLQEKMLYYACVDDRGKKASFKLLNTNA